MITRRDALSVVAALLVQRQPPPCRDQLILDLAASEGCVIRTIQVKLGALTATIPVDELLKALGAKLGG